VNQLVLELPANKELMYIASMRLGQALVCRICKPVKIQQPVGRLVLQIKMLLIATTFPSLDQIDCLRLFTTLN
jgi:hypothetical protein